MHSKKWIVPSALAVLALSLILLWHLCPYHIRVRHEVRGELVGPEDRIVLLLYDNRSDNEIKAAVMQSGKKVDEITDRGESLLSLAVKERREELVQWLLDQGANPNGVGKGLSPLMHAICDNGTSIAVLLIKHGADPDIDFGDGFTPFTPRSVAELDGDNDILSAMPPKAIEKPGGYRRPRKPQNAGDPTR